MGKTYTAQSVSRNHDWDYTVDDNYNITALVIRAEVNYGEMGRVESLDVWPLLNPGEKTVAQQAYNRVKQIYDAHFLG